MSFRILKNKEINKKRWDALVEDKGNSRMYLLSEYLDITAKDWMALVYRNYDAVMPLPFRKNIIGLRKHYIPLYIQQLGIIGYMPDRVSFTKEMILKGGSVFRNFVHPLNHENGPIQIDGFKSENRTNYELDLGLTYKEIKSNYKDNLIRNLKKAKEGNLRFHLTSDWQLIESFILKHSNPADPSPKHINTIKQIAEIWDDRYEKRIFYATKNKEPIAACLAPRFLNRITLLIPRSNEEGRKLNAMAYLIDEIIQTYANSHMTFDFEGSMLPGVANFYQQFGAVNKPYTIISK